MNMSVWLTVCFLLVTAAVILVAVYLVITLWQIKNTAKVMEHTLLKVNGELDTVGKVSDKVLDITGKLSNPLISAGSVLFYILSNIRSRKKNRRKEEENVQ